MIHFGEILGLKQRSNSIRQDENNAPFAGVGQLVARLAILVNSLLFAMLLSLPANASATKVSIPSSASSKVKLSGHLYRPANSGQAPAVVLMHGCGGWQPAVAQGLKAYADFLVSEGFVVLNLDSFGPRGNGGGAVCKSFKQLSDARKYRTTDAFDALRFLRAQKFVDPNRVFLIGQSNGGSVAMIAAMEKSRARNLKGQQGFRGVVALYPWCGATGSKRPNLSSPLLILGGALDDWVPPNECQRIKARGQDVQVTVYKNAAHSFDVPVPPHRYLGKLIGYNSVAAKSARRSILSFLRAQS